MFIARAIQNITGFCGQNPEFRCVEAGGAYKTEFEGLIPSLSGY